MFDPTAAHFYREPTWPASKTFCGTKALARITEGRPLEPDVSRVLSFFDGGLGEAIARAFLSMGGVDSAGRIPDMWVGSEWLKMTNNRAGNDRRSPDIMVVDRNEIRTVLLIVELKGKAYANGGHGYCPSENAHAHRYSNQIICYSGSCWTTAKNLDDVPRLLVGPDADGDRNVGWGRRALVPEDELRYDLGDALRTQTAALERWRFAGLRELEREIDGIPDYPGKDDALYVLRSWLDRLGL